MSSQRIGIFGGTFDPVHNGHLLVASDAFEALQLDLLLFVPAGEPPHKPGSVHASPEQRVSMIRAAIAEDARFGIDDLEIRREGASYTVDTLREITARRPAARLFFLMGVDQYRTLAGWREPQEVARLAQIVVAARGGESAVIDGSYGARQVGVRRVDISATEIRRRVSNGLPIRHFVPDAVSRVIEHDRLYLATPSG